MFAEAMDAGPAAQKAAGPARTEGKPRHAGFAFGLCAAGCQRLVFALPGGFA